MRGQAYSGLRRDVYNDESWSITAIKLRKKLPLGNCSCIALLTYIPVGILLERVGVTTARMQEVEQRRERLPRRIKIRKKALFDPLILT